MQKPKLIDEMLKVAPSSTAFLEKELPESKEKGEGKRLTTGNMLLTLSQLGTQLETAVKAYQQLPEATPQQVDDILKAIGNACGNAMAKAQKLLEGNR